MCFDFLLKPSGVSESGRRLTMRESKMITKQFWILTSCQPHRVTSDEERDRKSRINRWRDRPRDTETDKKRQRDKQWQRDMNWPSCRNLLPADCLVGFQRQHWACRQYRERSLKMALHSESLHRWTEPDPGLYSQTCEVLSLLRPGFWDWREQNNNSGILERPFSKEP